MNAPEFAYAVECAKTARQAIAALWSASLKAGWIVLGDYDMGGLIPDEQVQRGVEVKSIDICKPVHAKPFIQQDPMTALCMPCNVLVRMADGKTTIAALKPGVMLPRLFPEAVGALGKLPFDIDAEMKAIIDQAVAAATKAP